MLNKMLLVQTVSKIDKLYLKLFYRLLQNSSNVEARIGKIEGDLNPLQEDVNNVVTESLNLRITVDNLKDDQMDIFRELNEVGVHKFLMILNDLLY